MFGISKARWPTLSLACLAVACQPSAPAATLSTTPSFVQPRHAIPADLDVVMRVDLARIRATLGAPALAMLRRRAVDDDANDAGATELVADVLERADTVWVGLRPGATAAVTDSVIVARGNFAGIDVKSYSAKPAFSAARDLGAGWRVHERTPRSRAAPAQVYGHVDDVLVLVTEAEIDSVERIFEGAAGGEPLEPPERGLLSVVARPRPFAAQLEARSKAAARFLRQSDLFEGVVEFTADAVRVQLSLRMVDEGSARRAADAIGLLASELMRANAVDQRVAKTLDVEAFAETVVVRLDAPLSVLAAWSRPNG
jgi:hypothetical protein